jgi:hypothetical protein
MKRKPSYSYVDLSPAQGPAYLAYFKVPVNRIYSGKYIYLVIHNIIPDVAPQNNVAMFEAVDEF